MLVSILNVVGLSGIGYVDWKSRLIPLWAVILQAIALLFALHDGIAMISCFVLMLFMKGVGWADRILMPLIAGAFGFWVVMVAFFIGYYGWLKKETKAPLLVCVLPLVLISVVAKMVWK